ncbi:MAG: right-handed parallel beta-helix repeat-containing protein [Phycisphaerales bacterium]|nr:right-handed parallel beta-helix repeat-containing protein [Phycisphaerales bacterium]
MRYSLALQALTLALCASGAIAGTWHVPGHFSSIQSAINFASDGDVIQIAPGTYHQSFDLKGKAITVRGSGMSSTIIDGSGLNDTLIRCMSGEEASTVIEDMTVRDGIGAFLLSFYQGGGLYVFNAKPTIRRIRFASNYADGAGGGVSCFLASPTIEDCIFINNEAGFGGDGGGAIAMQGGSPVIHRCRFLSNSSGFLGGAISMVGSDVLISDSLFVKNTAPMGAGARVSGGAPTFANCTFAYNESDATVSTSGSAVRSASLAVTTIRNCVIWANTANPLVNLAGASTVAQHSTIQGGYSGGLYISWQNPQFGDPAGYDGIIGTEDDEFRLKPTSPCIDSGNNALVNGTVFDLLGRQRIADGNGDQYDVVDHGAYEFLPSTCPADCYPLGGDGIVNIDEIITLINNFGPTNSPCDIAPANANGTYGNGSIDIDDLVEVINSFGVCG